MSSRPGTCKIASGVSPTTPTALVAGNSACPACADASCSPEEMLGCAVDLWDAAYHLPDVLAGLARADPACVTDTMGLHETG